MSQPLRAGFRSFGRTGQPPPSSPPPPIPERDEGGGLAVSDYMMPRGMSSSGQWLNSQVEAFQATRTAPAPPPHGGTLRGMTSDQRAAYVAQRDADDAAGQGADAYRLNNVPARSSSVTAASFPPVPTMRLSTATVQEQTAAVIDPPSPQPVPEDAGEDPYDAPPQERATIELAQRVPSPLPSPTSLAPPPSPTRAPTPEAVALPPSPHRQLSVATLVAAPRPTPAPAAPFPADVEVEVRGVGVDRVLTIRLRQLGL